MKRFLTGTCVLAFVLLAFGSANAQDFKGFYIGGYAGGEKGHSDVHTFTVFSPIGYFATSSVPAIATAGTQKIEPSGFSGGGTFGYNWQHNSLVFGIESDFGSMKMSESKTSGATYPCCAPTAFSINQKIETNWLITARGRLGFAAGPLLVYGTGGLASTKLTYNEVFTDTFATAHESASRAAALNGVCGGAGVEFKLHKSHWSVKGEYLYADFGQLSTTSSNLTAFTPPIAFPTNAFTHNADLVAHMFRGGINFHF